MENDLVSLSIVDSAINANKEEEVSSIWHIKHYPACDSTHTIDSIAREAHKIGKHFSDLFGTRFQTVYTPLWGLAARRAKSYDMNL